MLNPRGSKAYAAQRLQEAQAKALDVTATQREIILAIWKLITRRPMREVARQLMTTSGKRLNVNALRRELALLGIENDRNTIAKVLEYMKMQMNNLDGRRTIRAAVEEQLAELVVLAQRLSQNQSDRALRLEVGIRALSLARIAVNSAVLEGRSKSELPGEANLDEDEKLILEWLRNSGGDAESTEPVRELELAISGYGRTANVFVLGVHAARSAIALLGSGTVASLLARLQFAYLSRGTCGEYWFIDQLDELRARVPATDLAATSAIHTKYGVEHCLMTAREFTHACLLTAASVLGGAIASKPAGRSKKTVERDYARMRSLAQDSHALCDDVREDRMIRAEVVAVGEWLKYPDIEVEANEFWNSLSREQVAELLGDITEYQRVGSLAELVYQSAQRVHAGVIAAAC